MQALYLINLGKNGVWICKMYSTDWRSTRMSGFYEQGNKLLNSTVTEIYSPDI